MSGLPPDDRIEVCFAGRSNVGKSTLINALTGRTRLARASNTPGRTQEINYFTLAESHYLVDLPGYGYANAPLDVIAKWQKLLKQYLAGRATLRRAFVLAWRPIVGVVDVHKTGAVPLIADERHPMSPVVVLVLVLYQVGILCYLIP